jgi:hypothetical protein
MALSGSSLAANAQQAVTCCHDRTLLIAFLSWSFRIDM